MCVDLGWSPHIPATLAGVSVMRDFCETVLVDVTFTALWAMQNHRNRVIVMKLAGFDSERHLDHHVFTRYVRCQSLQFALSLAATLDLDIVSGQEFADAPIMLVITENQCSI